MSENTPALITGLGVDAGILSREYFVWGFCNKAKAVTVADRMLGALCRLRGQLAAAPVLLTAEQYEVVDRALDDAATLHRCEGDPGQAAEYAKLAVELGREAGQ